RAQKGGRGEATLPLLPTLWFRNTWSWGDDVRKPQLAVADTRDGTACVRADHPELGDWSLFVDESAQLLFCENETNNERLFGTPNASPYVKDGINDYVVNGELGAVNPERVGTKLAAHHVLVVAPGEAVSIRVRLSAAPAPAGGARPLGAAFDRALGARRQEADEFYATVIPQTMNSDGANIMRQALAGMLWGKQ